MKMKKILCAALTGAMLLSGASAFCAGAEDAAPIVPKKGSGITFDNGYALGIPGFPTAGELAGMFEGEVSVSKDGTAIEKDKTVPSGAVISNGTEEIKAVIYGDVNGDAKFNIGDVTAVLKHIAKWGGEIDISAADVNTDSKVNVNDVTTILKKIAKWRVWLGGVGMTVTEEKQNAKAEDSSLKLAFGNGIDRYLPETEIGDAVTDVIYSAKGEIEFTQFALESEGGHKDLSVSVTDFKNAKGDTIRTEMYNISFIKITDSRSEIDEIADVMVPILTGIDIKAGAYAPFGIKAYPAADDAYGLYEATVTVKDAEGNELKKALVFLNVWDFVLPEASNCRTSLGLFPTAIGSTETATVEERYKNYYDFFIENRMNPSLLPYDICSEEAVEYMNDPRVNSFLAGGEGYGGSYDTTDDQLRERYALLSQNPEWMEKVYFYYDDEPLNFVPPETELPTPEQRIEDIENNYKHVRELFPGAKLIIPNHYNAIDSRFGEDIVGFVMDHSQILCPHMWMFNDYTKAIENVYYTAEMVQKYGPLKDRIDQKLADDPESEFWWYTSDNPRNGMCNIYITKPGIEARTLFWQQYLYGADGYLYWDIAEFGAVNSRNAAMNNEFAGLLCYQNKPYRTDEAIGSVRVEYVRDGIEDFDYLHMIEEQFGKDVADEFVSRITSDLLVYNTDSAYFEEVRMEMGELLQGWSASAD